MLSTVGYGAILGQYDDNGLQYVCAFAGRALHKHEKNYTISELELGVIVYALGYFKHAILGEVVNIVTDHQALLYLASIPALRNRLGRWAMFLSSIPFNVIFRKGKKDACRR